MNKFGSTILILVISLAITSGLSLYSLEADHKIVGGSNAEPNQYPYQISLQWNFNETVANPRRPFHFCGGSVINANWILTAAHCKVANLSEFGFIEVVAGEHHLAFNDTTEQRRQVDRFILHESYGGGVGPNDIAVIKVNESFVLNENVTRINFPERDSIPSGNATLTGWGSMSITERPNAPNILQTVRLPIIEYEECSNLWNTTQLAASNVCAGELNGSKSGCKGDSGGPLVQTDGDLNVVQIGVVSWGSFPCGAEDKPGIFVRVSHFVNWIQLKIVS
uniref:Putative trypsin-like serine protease n=1 Tax=Corethrella appendiculata TaxID=1370023 RepID=U5EP40_9DIPT